MKTLKYYFEMMKKEKSEKVNADDTKTGSSEEIETGNEQGEDDILPETEETGETEVTENEPVETEEGKPEGQEHEKRKHSREKELETKLSEQHDKYLRLSAEFDNYRKRVMKERIELSQHISADIYTKMLPIIDDFERAMATIRETEAMDAVRKGVELIYIKFKEHLNQQGIKEIDAMNTEFNTDYHDAVSRFPVEDENLKGKVIDIVEKGYTLNDKVIRFCKVVVGE